MRYLLFIISMIFILILASCECNCNEEKNEKIDRYGSPEEIESYSSHGYKSESWWYWSKGIEFTFTSSKDDCCDVSTYKFTPIKNITDEQKEIIKMAK